MVKIACLEEIELMVIEMENYFLKLLQNVFKTNSENGSQWDSLSSVEHRCKKQQLRENFVFLACFSADTPDRLQNIKTI